MVQVLGVPASRVYGSGFLVLGWLFLVCGFVKLPGWSEAV